MSRLTLTKITNAVYWLLLSAWFGCLAMTGIVAMIAFSTARELDYRIPSFSRYAGDHWPVAAGQIMNKVFLVNDGVQLVALIGLIAIMVLQVTKMGMPRHRVANAVRALCLFLLLCSTSYYLLVLSTRMNANLTEFWTRASAGEDGSSFKIAFDADHLTAENILKFNLVVLLILVPASACALTTREDEDSVPAVPANSPRTVVQEPELLTRQTR